MNEVLLPKARQSGLVIQDFSDELLIYDLTNNKAICLNLTAKLILEECDGTKSVENALDSIGAKLGNEISAEVVWHTVERLRLSGLLVENGRSPAIPRISRRELVKTGVGLGVALPVVTMLVVPSVSDAQSIAGCIPAGNACVVFNVNMDNCCQSTSCSTSSGGFCCIIGGIADSCDPANDLCCPGTVCNGDTLSCVTLP